nr:hypothetical protein [Tanacetum cinerariifolium]
LDSLAYVDQWPMQRIFKQEPDSAGRDLVKVEQENFARHQPLLEKIVRQYGYPGFRQVGPKSADNFWLLVQHADAHPDFQRRVLKLMLAEVEYSGPGLGKAAPKSLRDPAHVNQRRAAIGMEPLEEYLARMTSMHLEMNTPKPPNN